MNADADAPAARASSSAAGGAASSSSAGGATATLALLEWLTSARDLAGVLDASKTADAKAAVLGASLTAGYAAVFDLTAAQSAERLAKLRSLGAKPTAKTLEREYAALFEAAPKLRAAVRQSCMERKDALPAPAPAALVAAPAAAGSSSGGSAAVAAALSTDATELATTGPQVDIEEVATLLGIDTPVIAAALPGVLAGAAAASALDARLRRSYAAIYDWTAAKCSDQLRRLQLLRSEIIPVPEVLYGSRDPALPGPHRMSKVEQMYAAHFEPLRACRAEIAKAMRTRSAAAVAAAVAAAGAAASSAAGGAAVSSGSVSGAKRKRPATSTSSSASSSAASSAGSAVGGAAAAAAGGGPVPWREVAGTIDLEVIVRGRSPWDCQNGFDIAAPPSMTVLQLKQEVCLNTRVPPHRIFLTAGETALVTDAALLSAYRVASGATVRAQLLSGNADYVVMYIEPTNTAIRPMAVEMKRGDTVLDLKRKIAAEAGIAQTRQKIYGQQYSGADFAELPNTHQFDSYRASLSLLLATTGPVPPSATAAGSA